MIRVPGPLRVNGRVKPASSRINASLLYHYSLQVPCLYSLGPDEKAEVVEMQL